MTTWQKYNAPPALKCWSEADLRDLPLDEEMDDWSDADRADVMCARRELNFGRVVLFARDEDGYYFADP